jgi:arylsulfatase A
LAGTQAPADRKIDGVDLWPVLVGNPAKPPREIFHYFRGLDLEAVRSGPWKLHLASGELYQLENDVSEARNVAAENSSEVTRLRALAEAMRSDLGVAGMGPGVRPLGRVSRAEPIMSSTGKVRADMVGKTSEFP